MSAARTIVVFSAAALAAFAHAQATPPATPRPVEPGKADVDPLSTSQKLEPIDLRVPTGFDRVYELRVQPKGSPVLASSKSQAVPGEAGDRWFMRQSGALAVVFRQSVYEPTPQGLYAALPPGAIFGIGGVTPALLAQIQAPPEPTPEIKERAIVPARQSNAAAPLRASRVNLAAQSARSAVASESTARPQASGRSLSDRGNSQPPSIWTDEGYRRTRLGELIDEAGGPGPEQSAAAE